MIFAAMFALTLRRGVTDPVCGMRLDRRNAIPVVHEGRTVYVCSEGCAGKLAGSEQAPVAASAAGDAGS